MAPIRTLQRLLAVALLLGSATLARAADLQPALDLLDQAAQLRISDPTRSRTLAADAAALLRAADLPNTNANPPYQRALGNAHLLAGDLGHAVLAFRRAQAADPADTTIAASLAHARALLDAAPPESRTAAWQRIARSVTSQLPRAPVLTTAILALFAACTLVAARVAPRINARLGQWPLPTAVAMLALSAGAWAFLITDTLGSNTEDAVIITAAPARTGPDADIYPPAFSEPIPPGTEVTIRETRGTWARIALPAAASDAQAWIPLATLEGVTPHPPPPPPARQPAQTRLP